MKFVYGNEESPSVDRSIYYYNHNKLQLEIIIRNHQDAKVNGTFFLILRF